MSRHFKNQFIRIITMFISIGISLPVVAEKAAKEDVLYEIELLIFTQPENKNPELKSELWPDIIKFPSFNKSRELLTPAEYLLEVDRLTPDFYVAESMDISPDDLSPFAKKISSRKESTLLFHVKWRQTVNEENKTRPVFIADTGQSYLFQQANPVTSPVEQTSIDVPPEQQLMTNLLSEEKLLNQPVQEQSGFISETDPIEPFDQMNFTRPDAVTVPAVMGPPQHKLFGLVKLFTGRFPHLSIDLFYRSHEIIDAGSQAKTDKELFPMQDKSQQPASVAIEPTRPLQEDLLNQEKPPRVAYSLSASARIRLDEVQYFDHPMFGVIARIKKYAAPTENSATKSKP